MNILVVDIGGSSVKVWKTDGVDKVKFTSGTNLDPAMCVDGVRAITAGWTFDRVSMGYPGDVLHGHPAAEPYNLAPGWVAFDYQAAFGVPVRIMNDACMQALGSYDGGRMLYLGLGTSIGTAYIIDGQIVPLALGHLKYSELGSFEHHLSREGVERYGAKQWRRAVLQAAPILRSAFLADYVVLGGGNAKRLKELPEGCRRGGNQNAYFGGIRMWEDANAESKPLLGVYPKREAAAL